MKPVLAIIGRPNVGKSTLFNRLTRSQDALVANYPGLTRDRIYGEGKVGPRDYLIVDTGGLTKAAVGIDDVMEEQSLQAMDEADAILFMVDAVNGVTPADHAIADQVRKLNKPSLVVVNKVDGRDVNVATAEFHELGLPLAAISAAHNRGIQSLIESVLVDFPVTESSENDVDLQGTRIAIIGRPNVGKSTLVNRMLGEDRVVVYDQPGTTRDSIYIPYSRFDEPYVLIDTAGVRRRKNVKEVVEKFSIIKTLKAVDDANVVVCVFDAREGVVDQDLHVLSFVLQKGRALVIALNKWDGMTQEDRDAAKQDISRRLDFVGFANVHFISAIHGTGVGNLYDSVNEAMASATKKWATNLLTEILGEAVKEHTPPLVRGRRIKLSYAHQGGSNPPRIIIHGNQTEAVPANYKRYLENRYRKKLKISGTPIFIEFKSGDNPFAGRKNKLSTRQIQKKRRLMKHVKKR